MFISSAQLNILLPAVEPLPWPALPCFPDLCDMMTNPGLAGHPGSPATLRRLYTQRITSLDGISALCPSRFSAPPLACARFRQRGACTLLCLRYFLLEKRKAKGPAKGFCSGPCLWNKTMLVRLVKAGTQEMTGRHRTNTAKYITVRRIQRASNKLVPSSGRSKIGKGVFKYFERMIISCMSRTTDFTQVV